MVACPVSVTVAGCGHDSTVALEKDGHLPPKHCLPPLPFAVGLPSFEISKCFTQLRSIVGLLCRQKVRGERLLASEIEGQWNCGLVIGHTPFSRRHSAKTDYCMHTYDECMYAYMSTDENLLKAASEHALVLFAFKRKLYI